MAGRGKQVVAAVARWSVGAVFIYAGILKAIDPGQFIVDIDRFRLTPLIVSEIIGFYLPWLEIIAAAAFMLGFLRSGATLLLGTMLVVFLFALGSAWLRGLDISCGCFGHTINRSNYVVSIAIDLLLLFGLRISHWRRAEV